MLFFNVLRKKILFRIQTHNCLKGKNNSFQKFWQFKLKFPHAIKTTNNSNVMNVN